MTLFTGSIYPRSRKEDHTKFQSKVTAAHIRSASAVIFHDRLAYTSFRSLYDQRCGCPIIEPYAWNIKMKPCHTIIYKTNAPIGEANLTVQGTEPTFIAYGGYHDAGDADRQNLSYGRTGDAFTTYEAFKDFFTDDQFNIPDIFDANYNIVGKGNKIPDIIDEAEWGTIFWEYMQEEGRPDSLGN